MVGAVVSGALVLLREGWESGSGVLSMLRCVGCVLGAEVVLLGAGGM